MHTRITTCIIIGLMLNSKIFVDAQTCQAVIDPKSGVVNLLEDQTLNAKITITNVSRACNSDGITCNFMDPLSTELAKYMRKIDNATVQLIMPNMQRMSKNIACKYNNTQGLQIFTVRVGFKPKEIDFKCISPNYESMYCEFEDINNPLEQRYDISFNTGKGKQDENKNSGDENNESEVTNCQLKQNGTKKVCHIPMFRPKWEHIFTIIISNEFGSITQNASFNISTIVFMEPPLSVNVTNITSNSAVVRWDISSYFDTYNFPYIHRILLNSTAYDDWKEIKTDNVSIIDNTTFELVINNLEYAYTWYDIRVSIRTALALYGDQQWSDFKGALFMTAERRPDTPPKTAIGAFHIINPSDATLFWKELDKPKRNGKNSSYDITKVLENGKVSDKRPKTPIDRTTAKYVIDNRYNYDFHIISKNIIGRSSDFSSIKIPKKNDRLAFPKNLKKVLTNAIYTLTWENPLTNNTQPESYTILWCFPKDEQNSLCEKDIDFEIVDGSKNMFIYNNSVGTSRTTKIFAISTNSANSTSGMTWFPCSATNMSDMSTVPVMNEVLGPDKIRLSWTQPCDTTPLLQGFNISYCIVQDSVCKTKEETRFVPKHCDSYEIKNLVPYSTYSTKIAMFNGISTGPIAERFNTTQSGTPTEPYNLELIHVGNTTILLKWMSPRAWNGIPRHYKIYYNDNISQLTLDESPLAESKTQEYELVTLESYKNYGIHVTACNDRTCSNSSNKIYIKTKMGKPKKINEVKNTAGLNTYGWDPPSSLGGNLDYYEFKTEMFLDGDRKKTVISKLNRTTCTLNDNFCTQSVQKYIFYVRAVNKVKREIPRTKSSIYRPYDDSDQKYVIRCEEEFDPTTQEILTNECETDYDCLASDWTYTESSVCHYRLVNINIYILFLSGILVSGFILIAMYCVTKRVNKMKNINVELPAGLEDIDKETENVQPNLLGDDFRNADEQTERLLEKKSLPTSMISIDESTNTNGYISTSTGRVDTDEEKDFSQNSNNATPCLLPNVVNNVVEAQQKSPIPVHNPAPISFPVLANGYVSNAFMTSSLNMNPQPTNHVTLPPISSDGYTPISAFMNQNKIEPKPIESNFKTPIVTSTNGISGYVTHKQLSDFHNTLMQ